MKEKNAKERPLRFLLVGNPNCGKSTLFNRMTGERRPVGNLSGVTVERYEGRAGKCVAGHPVWLCDLPGLYSVDPLGAEEKVAAEALTEERYDAILNIVDGTCLERQLYLTLQLCALGRPMAVGVNMADLVERSGPPPDYEKLGRLLGGIPVLPICAKTGEGTERLLVETARAALRGKGPARWSASSAASFSAGKDFAAREDFPAGKASDPYKEIGRILREIRVKNDPAFALAPVSDRKGGTGAGGYAADRLFLAPVGGFAAMGILLAAVFFLTFGAPGRFCGGLLERLLAFLSARTGEVLDAVSAPPWATSLATDGILAGVFGVLGFLPQLTVLYTAVAVLEDSGIMARFSFLADPLFRKFGISGKAAVPFLMGFGCTVPALTATRILDSGRERFAAQCMLPFLACSARIPIYFYICERFFPSVSLLVSILVYLPGIAAAAAAGLLLRRGAGVKTGGEGGAAPFVLELPCYRVPSVKSVAGKVWVRIRHFLTRAATVILLLSMLLWFLQSFSPSLRYLGGAFEESLLAAFGRLLAPVFRPVGFGCAEAAVSLLSGLAAKEAVVSSLSVFERSGFRIGDALSAAGAASFLCFTALYTPCLAAVSTLKEEMGSRRRAAVLLLVQFLTAYVFAGAVYFVARLFFGC